MDVVFPALARMFGLDGVIGNRRIDNHISSMVTNEYILLKEEDVLLPMRIEDFTMNDKHHQQLILNMIWGAKGIFKNINAQFLTNNVEENWRLVHVATKVDDAYKVVQYFGNAIKVLLYTGIKDDFDKFREDIKKMVIDLLTNIKVIRGAVPRVGTGKEGYMEWMDTIDKDVFEEIYRVIHEIKEIITTNSPMNDSQEALMSDSEPQACSSPLSSQNYMPTYPGPLLQSSPSYMPTSPGYVPGSPGHPGPAPPGYAPAMNSPGSLPPSGPASPGYVVVVDSQETPPSDPESPSYSPPSPTNFT